MPVSTEKQLLSMLLADDAGIQWNLARTQEDRLIVLLHALRHAGLEVSGLACKVDMIPELSHRQSSYRADTGLRAMRFGSKGLVSVQPGVALHVKLRQIVQDFPQTHPGFSASSPYWVESFPMGQPQEELAQELSDTCRPLVDQARSVVDAWHLKRSTISPAVPRSAPRL